jgi:hypothetical protein
MRSAWGIVLGAAVAAAFVSPARAQMNMRPGGVMRGLTNYSMHRGCDCCPTRSRMMYGYANPGYYPGGVPYGYGVPYTQPSIAYPPMYGAGYAGGGSPDYASSTQSSMASIATLPPYSGSGASSQATHGGVVVDGVRMEWPVGLRVLAPTEVGGLRQQVEQLFEAISIQRASGAGMNESLTAAVQHALDRLQRLVNQDKNKAGLPLAVNQEAERFVAKLRQTLAKMKQA